MGGLKHFTYLGGMTLTFGLALVFAAPRLKAQSFDISLEFPEGEDIGAPERTGGGGQRGIPNIPCVTGNRRLTALTPTNNLITTISPNPKLFWYVPPTTAQSADFLLLDEQNQEIYYTRIPLTHRPGIVELKLPDYISLITEKRYLWTFALVCNTDDRSQDHFARGWIQRQPLQTGIAPPEELNTLLDQLVYEPEGIKKRLQEEGYNYAQERIWAETLMILARLYQQFPNDSAIADEMQELLTSVELDNIPINCWVHSCSVETQDAEETQDVEAMRELNKPL
ncbi:DUF928 domain-containing protein [Coleofasciculus sp. E1-EBD-02]|jgi:hypothetical protein|uniref:DUF928 domain-containing protein n=1 Tax=Coleofasciculus sp. E1-EBD-02 TaxID=3068481 RepID=UPI0033051D6B